MCKSYLPGDTCAVAAHADPAALPAAMSGIRGRGVPLQDTPVTAQGTKMSTLEPTPA